MKFSCAIVKWSWTDYVNYLLAEILHLVRDTNYANEMSGLELIIYF